MDTAKTQAFDKRRGVVGQCIHPDRAASAVGAFPLPAMVVRNAAKAIS
jgi:hypothetical protein